jgi:hypothetical protein
MKRLIKIVAALMFVLLLTPTLITAKPKAKSREYLELRVYHFATKDQESSIDNYLQNAFLPTLHKKGLTRIGVFKAIANDTAVDKKIFVLIPHKSIDQFIKLSEQLLNESTLQTAGADYLNAVYNKPPFTRFETILLSAFDEMTRLEAPNFQAPKSERVYELRSYEGPTERLYKNKVQMFNKGGEVNIFKRLGFNAVFYAEVIAGSKMPNLMYMTSFENMASRTEHWKSFSADPEWKKLSAMPEYQHNMTKAEITFLRPTDYSDI